MKATKLFKYFFDNEKLGGLAWQRNNNL